MYQQCKKGWLEVISDCVLAGKTKELTRWVEVLEHTKKKIVVFKPKIDDCHNEERVVSHCGNTARNFIINRTHEIFDYIDDGYDVITVDEAQLFDEEIVEICDYFADYRKRVMVAGLDMDFRGEPLSVMPQLSTHAKFVTKLIAVCTVCKAPATRGQRLIDSGTACYDDPVILMGASKQYEARCHHCHEVPGRPLIHK